jgi:hypothetical protein
VFNHYSELRKRDVQLAKLNMRDMPVFLFQVLVCLQRLEISQ